MATTISSQDQFEEQVKNATSPQLLIFHSSTSDAARIGTYKIAAQQAALDLNKVIDVLTTDIDTVQLAQGDVDTYQLQIQVICCTIINGGHVKSKDRDPSEATLRQRVQSMLRASS